MIEGCEKLGWEWWPTEQAITTRAYDGRPACDLKGYCPFGCPQGALATVDVTYWRKALRSAAGCWAISSGGRSKSKSAR